MRRYTACAAVMLAALLVCGAATLYKFSVKPPTAYQLPKEIPPQVSQAEAAAAMGADFMLDESFSSHLPLIIIDTGGQPVKSAYTWSAEEQNLVKLPEIDPYVQSKVYVLDHPGGVNRVTDSPVLESDAKIRLRGYTSLSFEKPHYLLKLEDGDGEDNKLSLLGMGADEEWILNGSMIDKSLMRNYLAYHVASQVMPYTPEARYCELIHKDGDNYEYIGVYLLLEKIKRGPDRLNISKYEPTSPYNSYLVRRDRYDEDEVILNTYATERGLSYGYLGVRYPAKSKIDQATINYIENDLSRIERVLYSEDPKEFITYTSLLDVNSFVDYFILNEYFANYDAGNHSTYMYKDVGEKLRIGPVWDYDMAMDNYAQEPLTYDMVLFQSAPWFDRLTKDSDFMTRVQARYRELRKSILSDAQIDALIDETAAYLGPAQQRDWIRWSHKYLEPHSYSLEDYVDWEGNTIHRETITYKQEVLKLKRTLVGHAATIDRNLVLLGYECEEVYDEARQSIAAPLSVLFLAGFLISVLFARRS